MRRIFLLTLILITGCQSTVGPFQARSPQRVDSPNITLNEQEARARNRWALPEESRKVAPNSGNEFLGWR